MRNSKSSLLPPEFPITDYILLLAMIDIYIQVMTEKGNTNLVEDAKDFKSRL